MNLKGRDFLKLLDYSKEEIESIFKDNSEIDVKIDSVNYKNKM